MNASSFPGPHKDGAFMNEKETQDIYRKLDNVLDLYFEELANRIERHKDILNLQGWLRVNLYNAISNTHTGKE
jgi:hypothetical protein